MQQKETTNQPQIFITPAQLKKIDFLIGDFTTAELSEYVQHMQKLMYHYLDSDQHFDKDEITRSYLTTEQIINLMVGVFEWYGEVENQKISAN